MKSKLSRRFSAILALTLCVTMNSTGFAYGGTIKNAQPAEKESRNYVEGEAVVLFTADSKVSEKQAAVILGKASVDLEVEDVINIEENRTDVTDSIAVVSSGTSTEKLVSELNKLDGVEIAEPNYIAKKYDVRDAKYFGSQWALDNKGQDGGTVGEDINIDAKPQATGEEKVVAVLDTGVDYTHPDLEDIMWTNDGKAGLVGEYGINVSDSGKFGDPMDDDNHGTHCAGVIAGQARGIAGVNQDVKIMAMKFLDEDGSGDMAGAIACYEYVSKAIDAGVNVVAVSNSWGIDEYSKIFDELITRLGEKGVVTVAAAGNDGSDMNEDTMYESYPACYKNPYVLTVAATDNNGDIASFSNYGDEYVDVAAPGVGILSSVGDYTYNPALYGDCASEQQNRLSQKFNDFEGCAENDLNRDFTPEFTDADKSDGVDLSITDDMFQGAAGGHSLKIAFDGKDGDYTTIRVPYTVDKNNNQNLMYSLAYSAPEANVGFFADQSFAVAVDVPKGAVVDENTMESYEFSGYYIYGESGGWDCVDLSLNEDNDPEGTEREIVFLIVSHAKGSYEVYLDNIGIANPDVAEEEFGKYEFMSGTSMATPLVAGVVASFSDGKADEVRTISAIENTMKTTEAKSGFEGKVLSGGVIKYGSEVEIPKTLIAKEAKVNLDCVRINGYGFDAEDLKVELRPSSELYYDEETDEPLAYEEAKIIQATNTEIDVEDNSWINHYVDVRVTASGKSAEIPGVYLIDGKPELKSESIMRSALNNVTTDGKNIYAFSTESSSFGKLVNDDEMDDPDDLDDDEDDDEDLGKMYILDPFAKASMWKLFDKRESENASYTLSIDGDMAYADGKLYAVMNLNEIVPKDSENIISQEKVLVEVDIAKGKVKSLGEIPDNLKTKYDVSMGSYNGVLYFIGGYDRSTKKVSTDVIVFNPAKGTWSVGASIPEARGGGKVLQSGRYLTYSLGYGVDEGVPAILVFDGKEWKTSSAELEIFNGNLEIVNRGSKKYDMYTGNVGRVAGGLMFIDICSDGYGDLFTYNINRDVYEDTGLIIGESDNESSDDDIWDDFFNIFDDDDMGDDSGFGIVVGDKLVYSPDAETMYTGDFDGDWVKITSSGKNGKVKGAGKYLAGSKVTVTGVGNAGYYCKKLASTAGSANGAKLAIRATKDIKVTGTYARYKISVPKSIKLKAGKTYKIKTKFSPTAAKSQKKLTYKSSNSKYLTVTKKGVIKAKKAGKGKTVTVTVRADRKVYKKIKVKVK